MSFQSLITTYNVPYHRIRMACSAVVDVTLADVEATMGIPCTASMCPFIEGGLQRARYIVYDIWNHSWIHYLLVKNLKKKFLIFTCATILAANSKLEGMHDLWDFIWDIDVLVLRNWGKLMLDYLEDGIQEFKATNGRYVWGCLLFLQVQLEVDLLYHLSIKLCCWCYQYYIMTETLSIISSV